MISDIRSFTNYPDWSYVSQAKRAAEQRGEVFDLATLDTVKKMRMFLGDCFNVWTNAKKQLDSLQQAQEESVRVFEEEASHREKERDAIRLIQIAEDGMQSLGVAVKDGQFLISQEDLQLAKEYGLVSDDGLSSLRCLEYAYYHLNIPMESLVDPIFKTLRAETDSLWKIAYPKSGDFVLYWDEGTDMRSAHVGMLHFQIQKKWQVLSKWGLGPVISHPIDLHHSSYSSNYVFFRPKYGIPLYRSIVCQATNVLDIEKTKGPFHAMTPSPLTPLGVVKRWKQWVQETDRTIPLFTKAMVGERSRRVCAQQFISHVYSPIRKSLEKDPWAISRTEVTLRIRRELSELDRDMYALLFSSFWDKIPSKKMEEKSRRI